MPRTPKEEIKKIDKNLAWIKKRSPDSKPIKRFVEYNRQATQNTTTKQFAITLPKEWCRNIGLHKGEDLLLLTNGYDPSVLVVVQEKEHIENQIQISRVKAFIGSFGDVLESRVETKLRLEAEELKKRWLSLLRQQKEHLKKRKLEYAKVQK